VPVVDGKAAAARKRRIFVANYGDETVSVMEGDGTEAEAHVLTGFESPQGLAIRVTEPARLAVANGTAYGITVIDPDTLERVGFIETKEPADSLAFSADGKFLYTLSVVSSDVTFIDMDSLAVAGDPVKFPPRQARHLAVDPVDGRIFVLLVTGEGPAEMTVIDPKTRAVGTKAPADIFPKAFALGNNRRYLVSASFDNSTLTVVDTESMSVIATHPSPTGLGLSVHPTKPIAYTMASFDDEFHIVDLETGKLVKTISAGRYPTYSEFSGDGRYLYIPHEESDSLVKLDTETNEVVAKVVVGKEPVAVAVYEP
jgi:YVTN family beta-propeller protein